MAGSSIDFRVGYQCRKIKFSCDRGNPKADTFYFHGFFQDEGRAAMIVEHPTGGIEVWAVEDSSWYFVEPLTILEKREADEKA